MRQLNNDIRGLDEAGQVLKAAGLALETDAFSWQQLWDVPLLRAIAYLDVPCKFNPFPLAEFELLDQPYSYEKHLSLIEYLSRFDASSLLALPGPSLASQAVIALGSESQIEHFFGRFLNKPHWAFFAVTEPTCGSDAGAVQSTVSIQSDKLRLNGTKMLVGNAQRASVGLVFTVLENGQQCIVEVEPLLHPASFLCNKLNAFGLAGAGLCSMKFFDFPVSQDQILGFGKTCLRQGISALVNVFERHRPMVGAMALGTAFGTIEALASTGADTRLLARLKLEHESLLRQMFVVGTRYEQGLLRGHEASLFKRLATQFNERVASYIPMLGGPTSILSSPYLAKRYRDAFAFEYMEGTSNIHLMSSYRSYVAGRKTSHA